MRVALFVLGLLASTAWPSGAEIILPKMESEPVTVIRSSGEDLLVSGRRNLYRIDPAGKSSLLASGLDMTSFEVYRDELYIGTTNGLYKQGQEDPIIPAISVNDMEVWGNSLWVGTNRGLFELGSDQPPLRFAVLDLAVIHQQLWIGSFSGAAKIQTPGSEPIEIDFGEETPPVAEIVLANGEIWLRTLRNTLLGRPGPAYSITDDGRAEIEPIAEGRAVTYVRGIGGSTWLGTTRGALVLADSATEFFRTDSPVNLIHSANGFVYIGTTSGLWQGSEGSSFRLLPASSSMNIKALAEHRERLWIGSQLGLHLLDSSASVVGSLDFDNAIGGIKLGRYLQSKGVRYWFEDGLEYRRDWRWCVIVSDQQLESLRSRKGLVDEELGPICYPVVPQSTHELSLWRNNSVSVFFEDEHGNRSRIRRFGFWVFPSARTLGWSFLAIVSILGLWYSRKVIQETLYDQQKKKAIDSLTGLPRRGQGGRKAALERFELISSHGNSWALIVIDLDDFGLINKIHGMATGDRVLSAVGKTLQESGRGRDYPVRWGGEEFLVIVDSPDSDATAAAAKRILRDIASIETPTAGDPIRVTASVGICDSTTCSSSRGNLFDLALETADLGVRKAKKNGKNQIQWASSDELRRAAEQDSSESRARPD